MKFYPFGATTYNLGTSIGSTDTSILLSSFLEPVTGVPYTMILLNTDIVYGTIAPKTTSSEFISFTGITQNADGTATLTGVTRGLAKKYPFTTDAAYKLPHSGQTQFIISDAPQVFQEYISLVNDESVDGIKTFTSFPVTPSSPPTTDYQVANKKYVDDTAIAGSPNATTSVKGIVQLATQAQVDAGTVSGSTGASLVPTPDIIRSRLLSDYKVDTGAANAYVITPSPAITAYTVGQIFSFKAVNANTTVSTLNVNGLGAKTIKKIGGGTDLASGDIAVGQIVLVEYDGTNMIMLNPVANPPATIANVQSGSLSFAADAGSTDTYVITISPAPVAYTTGMVVNFTANTANTGAATLNVNGLGAKTIKKKFNIDLNTNDIVAGQAVSLVYDGTNFQMTTTPTNVFYGLATKGTSSKNTADASTTQTIAHGLGVTPASYRLCVAGSNSLAISLSGNSSTFFVVSAGVNTAVMFSIVQTASNYQEGVVTADATNINIAWTKLNSPTGTVTIDWEAFA